MTNLAPVQTVLAKLEGAKPAGPGKWSAKCPAHDDAHASLSIGTGDDGRALIHCHAGCALDDVLAKIALKDADLFPASADAALRSSAALSKRRAVKTVYTTAEEAFAAAGRQANGEFVAAWPYPGDTFRVIRFKLADGSKTYRPIHRNGGGWSIGDPAGLLPLYLGDSIGDAGPIFVVEGEKCADAAAGVGLIAVTSAHGCGSAHKSDWTALAGREVIILPDNDSNDAGLKYAQEVAEIVTALNPPGTVKIVTLPGLPEHGDIADWISADGHMDGKSADEIKAAINELVKTAKAWMLPPAKSLEGEPVITCLADVTAVPVKWLWPSRIALGKLTLIVGDPGLGKSFITLDIAGRVSRGVAWPDCPQASNTCGGVVLLSAEDDLADTIRPRLDAAGADVSRIAALTTIRRFDPALNKDLFEPFNLTDHLPALERAIKQVGDCRLVIIDPISAYLGKADSHKNAEVRGMLMPLSELAARHGVAVIAVNHLRKGDGPAMYRAMGSLAFVAAARAAYGVARDKDDITGQRRFFLPVKNNLGNDRDGLAYSLDDTISTNRQPVVSWEAVPVSVSADEALSSDDGGRRGEDDQPERDEAKIWLADTLAAGPKTAKEVLAQARQDGISKRTLDRAKKSLNVTTSKSGFNNGWTWRLPGTPDAPAPAIEDSQVEEDHAPRQETLAIFHDVGNLREKPKKNEHLSGPANSGDAEGCQAPESGNLRLDPDRPGPTDLLSKAQYQRYRAVYDAHNGEPDGKHAAAWRAAVAGGKE